MPQIETHALYVNGAGIAALEPDPNGLADARRAATVEIEEIAEPMFHFAQRAPRTGGHDITVSVETDGAFSFLPHSAAARDFLATQHSLISRRNLTKADLDRIVGLARGRRYAVLNCVTSA